MRAIGGQLLRLKMTTERMSDNGERRTERQKDCHHHATALLCPGRSHFKHARAAYVLLPACCEWLSNYWRKQRSAHLVGRVSSLLKLDIKLSKVRVRLDSKLEHSSRIPAAAELNMSARTMRWLNNIFCRTSAAAPRHASRNEGQSSGVRLKGTETPHWLVIIVARFRTN